MKAFKLKRFKASAQGNSNRDEIYSAPYERVKKKISPASRIHCSKYAKAILYYRFEDCYLAFNTRSRLRFDPVAWDRRARVVPKAWWVNGLYVPNRDTLTGAAVSRQYPSFINAQGSSPSLPLNTSFPGLPKRTEDSYSSEADAPTHGPEAKRHAY